jgi:hypothetical protein
VIVVPFIENRADLIKLYKENLAEFWLRLLVPEDDDTLFEGVLFLIIDGAHRYYVCKALALVGIWARFLPPTMSFGALVCCPFAADA